MPSLDSRIMDEFAHAILQRDPPATAPGFTLGDGDRAIAGLNVYRNNVRAGLTRALADKFPVLEKLVGEAFFKALARAFFDVHPPHSPMVRDYGDCLPGFLRRFEPAKNHPYLADVAAIEILWLKAYHGEDAEPLAPAAIIAAAGDDLAAARFELHPTTQLSSLSHGALTIWRANKADGAPPRGLRAEGDEFALIARPEMDVVVHALPQAHFAALRALTSNASLGAAIEAAAAVDAAFDAQAFFQALFQWNIITRVIA